MGGGGPQPASALPPPAGAASRAAAHARPTPPCVAGHVIPKLDGAELGRLRAFLRVQLAESLL